MKEPVTTDPKKENEATTEEDKTKDPKEQSTRENLFSVLLLLCVKKKLES